MTEIIEHELCLEIIKHIGIPYFVDSFLSHIKSRGDNFDFVNLFNTPKCSGMCKNGALTNKICSKYCNGREFLDKYGNTRIYVCSDLSSMLKCRSIVCLTVVNNNICCKLITRDINVLLDRMNNIINNDVRFMNSTNFGMKLFLKNVLREFEEETLPIANIDKNNDIFETFNNVQDNGSEKYLSTKLSLMLYDSSFKKMDVELNEVNRLQKEVDYLTQKLKEQTLKYNDVCKLILNCEERAKNMVNQYFL